MKTASVMVVKWFYFCLLLQQVLSDNKTPPNTEEDYSSISKLTSEEEKEADLAQLDSDILNVYKNPDPLKKQTLINNLHLYLKNLRLFNKLTKKGCEKTSSEATRLVHSGGPDFLKTHMFSSDDENIFRHEMDFSDFEFQNYQFNRLDTENEWSELKDQIAHLDRDKEKEKEEKMKLQQVF